MVNLFVVLALATSTAFKRVSFAQAQNFTKTPVVKTAMLSPTSITISHITLQAREERRPSIGVPTQPQRDIGFASVFLSLENPKQSDANLIIQRIEILNVYDGKIQLSNQSPQEIHLRPLENSEQVFHLTNKTGYSRQGKVKAVITYQLGNQTRAIESAPIDVDRD